MLRDGLTPAGEAAREKLAAEGLAKEVSLEAITDPSRGLFLRIKAAPDKAVAAQRLLQKFPVKIEIEP
jgi:fatty-acyl-CoA synthase